ncbi:hypothetical protein RB195_000277 [Necator americanus]|uniref:Metalloendopeptidase n=1 Tax=Necator americanus TaxID=51031 RepID=A0ABR1D8U6_NECAM
MRSNPVRGVSRKGNSVNRWSNNIIPYTLSSQYSEEQKKIIRNSLATLESISCFRFVQRTTERDFLVIVPLDGCYSFVGKIGGPQKLSLAADCVADYIVWHEMMHAIGFEHEHQRPDRDNFIRVVYNNVQPGQIANFEKLSPNEVDYDDEYDYESIMHYDSYAFGRRDPRSSRRLATMIPKKFQKGVALNDNLKMSPADIRKLNELGKCNNNIQEEKHSFLKEEESVECIDEIGYCGGMWEGGFCTMEFYRPTMLKYCAKTCGLCDGAAMDMEPENEQSGKHIGEESSPDCKDKDPQCPFYARNGFCTDPFYEGIRAVRCPYSCNLCGAVSSSSSPTTSFLSTSF